MRGGGVHEINTRCMLHMKPELPRVPACEGAARPSASGKGAKSASATADELGKWAEPGSNIAFALTRVSGRAPPLVPVEVRGRSSPSDSNRPAVGRLGSKRAADAPARAKRFPSEPENMMAASPLPVVHQATHSLTFSHSEWIFVYIEYNISNMSRTSKEKNKSFARHLKCNMTAVHPPPPELCQPVREDAAPG